MTRVFERIGLALIAIAVCTTTRAEADGPQQVAVMPAPITVGSIYWGTGFFVDRAGHVLTAYHLVSDCSRIDIVANGEREPASVIATSADHDLGILRVSRTVGEPVAFDTAEAIGGGAMVSIIGYRSLQDTLRHQDSAQPAVFNSMVLDEHRPDHIALLSDAEGGASGSPVITRDGLVAGILQAKETREGMPVLNGQPSEIRVALNGAVARDFLRDNGIAPIEGKDTQHARLNLIGGLAAAEVKIECHR